MIGLDKAKRSVITVGDGRGFVVETKRERLVITAAHCLPHLPPACSFAREEDTYFGISPLGKKPTVIAECLFVDPVSDIAVLGPPDNQMFCDEFDAYEELMQTAVALPIAALSTKKMAPGELSEVPAHLLSLKGAWFRCTVQYLTNPLWIRDATKDIVGGMSGSPIVLDDGSAIGVMVCSASIAGKPHRSGGPNPRLTHHLPGWLLNALSVADGKSRRAVPTPAALPKEITPERAAVMAIADRAEHRSRRSKR